MATLACRQATGLAEAGHEVRVLAYTGTKGKTTAPLTNLQETWHRGISFPVLRLLSLYFLVICKCMAGKWDLIYSPTYRGFGLPVYHCSRVFGIPYILYIHGTELNTEFRNAYRARVFTKVIRGALHILVNSNATKALLLSRLEPHEVEVEVITPGVEVERFSNVDEENVTRTRARLLSSVGGAGDSVGEDPLLLLTVSRLSREKGLDLVLKAVQLLRSKGLFNVYLVIAGEGPDKNYLVALTNELNLQDAVLFTGRIADVDLEVTYAATDIFLQTSQPYIHFVEGFGISLLEAQAAGKPCIATEWGGIPEAVHKGETALLVPVGSAEQIAGAIQQLATCRTKRLEMGRKAREWATFNNWKTHVTQLAASLTIAASRSR